MAKAVSKQSLKTVQVAEKPVFTLAGESYRNFSSTIKSPQTKQKYIECLKQFMLFMHVYDVAGLITLEQKPYRQVLSTMSRA